VVFRTTGGFNTGSIGHFKGDQLAELQTGDGDYGNQYIAQGMFIGSSNLYAAWVEKSKCGQVLFKGAIMI